APLDADRARLFVGAGRADGLRPGDLVGAIAKGAGIPGRAIGAIRLADRFALVDLPADAIDHVIEVLRGITWNGRRVLFRRDQHG
ncbi:MAG: ATP-dependent helicase, partial [Planctomycetes bacterium]|nr:ATP-dependent helicase [Planctomycetota bacterium]